MTEGEEVCGGQILAASVRQRRHEGRDVRVGDETDPPLCGCDDVARSRLAGDDDGAHDGGCAGGD